MSGSENPNYKHGGHTVNRPEYNSWRAMRARCNDPNYRRYDRYGGRGIKVCAKWDDGAGGFVDFLSDMGKKPSPKHTIDRIDNDKGYTPDNCRWSLHTEQIRNSTRIRNVTIDGVTAPIGQHITTHGKASLGLIYKRIREGWTVEEAIRTDGDIGRKDLHKRLREKWINKIPNCLWCQEPVGNTPGSRKKKYCSPNHYMLHRMNPAHNITTYKA